jgi:hypothetical protein
MDGGASFATSNAARYRFYARCARVGFAWTSSGLRGDVVLCSFVCSLASLGFASHINYHVALHGLVTFSWGL